MKTKLKQIMLIIGILLIIAKISEYFIAYNHSTLETFTHIMFMVIGGFYFVVGFYLKKTFLKMVFFISGLYLLIMNFLPESTVVTLIGIVLLLVSISLMRYSPEVKESFFK